MQTAVLFALLVSAHPVLDKTKFEWKPVVGSKATYATTNTHKGDFGGGEGELKITWNSVITVKSADGKKVELDVVNDEPKATFDGQEEAGIQVQVPDEVQTYSPDLKFAGRDDDEGFGVGMYAGFLLPETALEINEVYSVGGVKAKFVGTEKVGEWQAHKFTFEFVKGKSKDGMWTEGTIWLLTSDLSLVKRTATFHNMDFGMGNEDVKNEIVRTK